MSDSAKGILVLGAGELGTAILRELAKPHRRHSDITVLLRPPTTSDPNKKDDQIAEFRNLGINVLFSDIASSNQSELAQLFRGFDTVLSATGYVAGPGTQLKLCRSVLEAGVRRYFPWQFGVDYDTIGRGSGQELFDEQLDVRALLRAQTRTEWVIISTGVFTSFLFAPFFGVVDLKHSTVHALGDLHNRLTVTAVEDIARLTAEVLLAEPQIKNTVVFVAGDTLSYSQVADIVESLPSNEGRRVNRKTLDLPTLQRRLRDDPDNVINKYSLVFAGGRGVAWDIEQTYNGQHHIPVVTAKQWAIENIN